MPTESSRKCGDCTACCVIFEVPAVKKPQYEPCRHLCDKGCGIHFRRPEMCRAFRCMWLTGFGEESGRPDKSHRILSYYKSGSGNFAVLQIACMDGYRIGDAETRALLKEFMNTFGFTGAVASVTYDDGSYHTVRSVA